MNEGEVCKNTTCEFYDKEFSDDYCAAEMGGEPASASCLKWQQPEPDKDALLAQCKPWIIRARDQRENTIKKAPGIIYLVPNIEKEIAEIDELIAALDAAGVKL
jgi:hypothetical protein